jgi:hypothetical protein
MKRSKGTKHGLRRGSTAGSQFLLETQKLVAECAKKGERVAGIFGVPTPYGTVEITVSVRMLVHTAAHQTIVRPS